MTKRKFAALAFLAAGAGLAAAALIAPRIYTHATAGRASAMWAEHFETLGDLSTGVDAVVVATVTGTRPGRVVSTSGGQGALPFTLVDLRLDRAVLGSVGTSLIVEQTGGQAADRTVYLDDDGGPYRAGDQVLLFLNRQPGTAYYYLVNPQGRFQVDGGRLRAVAASDPVARQLDGSIVDQAVRLILAAK